MTEPDTWDARAPAEALVAGVARAITAERSRAAAAGRHLTDAAIARAVLRSPAMQESARAVMDGLEAEYRPKIAAMVADGAGAIRADAAEQIARAIEASVCAPGDQCADRFCTDCTRYRQAQADAELARRIGGAVKDGSEGGAWPPHGASTDP